LGKQPHPVKNNFVQKSNNQPRIGRTYRKQTKQRIRNNIMMATWNVCTMLQPGKMQEVAQEMAWRWLDDVKSDLKKMEVKGRKEKMLDREQWRLVVEEAKAHPRL
jgi:hypothetical protein